MQLTAPASAGASLLNFPAEYYDFDDDTLAALMDIDDETNFEIVTLETVGNTSSTLAGVTVNSWPTGTLVVPVRRALMRKEIDVRRHTDAMQDVSIVFDILAEDVALTPRRNGTYTPRYTYKGIEVFDPFILGTNNFSEEGRGAVTVRAVDPDSPAGIFLACPKTLPPARSLATAFSWTRAPRSRAFWPGSGPSRAAVFPFGCRHSRRTSFRYRPLEQFRRPSPSKLTTTPIFTRATRRAVTWSSFTPTKR